MTQCGNRNAPILANVRAIEISSGGIGTKPSHLVQPGGAILRLQGLGPPYLVAYWVRIHNGEQMGSHNKFYLTCFFLTSLAGSAASSRPVDRCSDAPEVQQLDAEQERARLYAATAILSYVPRSSDIAIWDADSGQWHAGTSGSALRSGDAVCVTAGVSPAMIRSSSGEDGEMIAVTGDQQPFIVEGRKIALPSSITMAWMDDIDWPTGREMAAIERGLGRAGRQRTGATRGMSVGSTPRAVYLGGAGLPAGITRQKMLIKLDRQMWGWCSTDEQVIIFDGEKRLAQLSPFEPQKLLPIKDATEIRIASDSGTARKIAIEWITDKDLPIPDWIKAAKDPLLSAIWLSEHESGEYQWIGHTILDGLAQSRPAALHYLAHRSNCGRGYSYKPSLEIVRN